MAMPRFDSVDDYVDAHSEWHKELVQLRNILLETGLEEAIKWGAPCYVFNGKNVVGIAAFKKYVGLWFHQGALLADRQKVLISAQEGKTKALRQWRFQKITPADVRSIKSYAKEAMELCAKGIEIKPDRAKPVSVPPELQKAFSNNKKAATAFKELTLGKQREYAEYIESAKRADTKEKRLEKIIPMVIAKVGLNDKYRKC